MFSLSAEHLKQAAVLQVILDDHVGHGIEDKLNVGSVCGACEVCVDFLHVALGVPASVETLELELDVGGSILVGVGAAVFWEADGQR